MALVENRGRKREDIGVMREDFGKKRDVLIVEDIDGFWVGFGGRSRTEKIRRQQN